eukprot:gene16743-19888_t
MLAESYLTPTKLQVGIEIKSVTFTYPCMNEPSIIDTSVSFPAGKKCSVVGRSGSGKTTMVKLLSRVYNHMHGEILIGGIPLRLLAHKETVATMEQECLLFDMSMRENILLGCTRDVDDHELETLCRNIFVMEDSQVAKEGLDLQVGSKGTKVNMALRQKVCLARALIRRCPVLILDEPVSSQEYETQMDLALYLRSVTHLPGALDDEVAPMPTTVIALTFSQAMTNSFAEYVAMLVNGTVVESGTREELLMLKGHYWRLSTNQAGLHFARDKASISPERLASMWPFWGAQDHDMLMPITNIFSTYHMSNGECLFRAGEPQDKYYIVVRGYVIELRGNEPIKTWAIGDVAGDWGLYEDHRTWRTDTYCKSNKVYQNMLKVIPSIQQSVYQNFLKIQATVTIERLSSIWPFSGLSKEELEDIRQELDMGDVEVAVVPYGTQGEDLFSPDFQDRRIMSRGEFYGELCPMAADEADLMKDRMVRARAITPVLLAQLTRESMDRVMLSFGTKLFNTMRSNVQHFKAFSSGEMLLNSWLFTSVTTKDLPALCSVFTVEAMQ